MSQVSAARWGTNTQQQVRFGPRRAAHWQSWPEQRAVRRRGALLRCRSTRDPLELEIWNSWQDAEDDWATENFTEDELVDILFDGDGSAETAAQNILAVALSLLLAIAAGSIVWRLAVVSFALISAALRYSVVAVVFLFWFLITF